MNIVYCIDSVCYPGGIQRITIAKANALAAIESNNVSIVVTDNKRPKPVLPISDKVSLVDLGIDYYADDWKSRWHILKGVFIKRKRHKVKLCHLLNSLHPDIVISTGTSEKYFLPHLKVASSPAFIREIHFPKDYRLRSAQGLFEKIMAVLGNFADFRINIWSYDRIVLLTNEDLRLDWRSNTKLTVIPNPVTVPTASLSSLQNKIAIAVGRLEYPKNFESLIRTWGVVHQKHRDWRLEIWGDGSLREGLQEQINRNLLEKVVLLKGYTDDIYSKYENASFLVCSSLFEGFGLMMLEAMFSGLPIISYDCPCGPRELIQDNNNGFLVQLGDERMLAEQICRLIEDENLRQRMGASAHVVAKGFSIEKITNQWITLFNSVLEKK